MRFLSEEAEHALNVLASRCSFKLYWTYSDLNSNTVRCSICCIDLDTMYNLIANPESARKRDEHGIFHLKENNLLPFL